MHDSAFAYDDDLLAQDMVNGTRKFDQDGSLAAKLQSTVRCGDPWNEGIVWPRIAEISLLGGLGCGKTLLSLVLEKLAGMKPTGNQNYDYAVLQATENSIPFYESMGFVRVGCITEDENFKPKTKKQKSSFDSNSSTDDEASATLAVTTEPSSPTNDLVSPSEIVSSAVHTYEVVRAGETVIEIAKKINVSPFDIIFLNQYIYKEIMQNSYLMKGTKLFVPSEAINRNSLNSVSEKSSSTMNSDAPRWHIAKENDTPKMIAKIFKIKCNDLVEANRERLPELMAISRLKEGTRIKVSHFHIHDDQHVPYCHWTFPDDSFDENEPSYMMARSLNRRVGAKLNHNIVQMSLAVPIKNYVRPPSSLFATVPSIVPAKTSLLKKTPKNDLKEPLNPTGLELSPSDSKSDTTTNTLFNKVVKVKHRSVPSSHKEFEYFYVLTFIPDLHWCHLVPMRKAGTWGDKTPKAEGRPIWMLVDESEGMEVDISASFCIPVQSKAMKKTVDADEEQWDILESGSVKTSSIRSLRDNTKMVQLAPVFTNRASDGLKDKQKAPEEVPNSMKGRSATKPLTGTVERKRKRSSAVNNKDAIDDPPKSTIPSEPVLSTQHENQTRRIYRDLPHRKAAPVHFDESSPSTKRNRLQSPTKAVKQVTSRKLKVLKKVIKGSKKKILIKESKTNSSQLGHTTPIEQSASYRGFRSELPPRQAAQTLCEDISRVPKKHLRNSMPPSLPSPQVILSKANHETPRFRSVHREIPPRRAAPTFSQIHPLHPGKSSHKK